MVWILTLVFIGLGLPAFAQEATPARQPCAYFPESLIREAFAIPAAQNLERTAKNTCRFAYTGNAQSASQARLQSISLNFFTGKFSPTRIDQLFNRLKNGYTGKVREREVVIAPKDVEWVTGVGDKAFWNNDLNQLAVSARNQLFYVTVALAGMPKAQKMEAAKRAAAGVIAKL